jgi:hypothetical protein
LASGAFSLCAIASAVVGSTGSRRRRGEALYESVRVPFTSLGKIDDFQGDTIGQVIALAEAKLGARTVKSREHDLDVLRIEG